MPKLSDTMKEGILVKWLKQEGDKVSAGDVLAEIETDKATMELEVFEEGIVRKRFGEEGEGIPIGAVVAILAETEEEDISALMPGPRAAPAPLAPEASVSQTLTAIPPPAPAPAPAPPTSSTSDFGGRLLVSPVARRMAEEKGLDLSRVQGTGPSGRIIKRDVVDLEETQTRAPSRPTSIPPFPSSNGPEVTEVPLTSMRKIIGRRLADAKFSAPHFYVSMDVDMGPAIAFRKELKGQEVKVSFNDLILKAVATGLSKVPALNANFNGERLLQFRDVHLGFAVAFEGGLITPVIRQANRKSLGQIAAEARELIVRAKERKLAPEEYTGGTFTISNLGMFGVSEFTAILNVPEVGILAVGGIRHEPVVEGDAVVPGHRMKLTVSVDHRAADGADAARFLGEVQRVLEKPALLAV
jgi:pyruvate dehydrogenase E2 component (dihydrolipoamide acetyltransferase)